MNEDDGDDADANDDSMTYVVADVKYAGKLRRDVGVIARHERRVADDT